MFCEYLGFARSAKLLQYRMRHVLILHPSKKVLFLLCPHQSAPLSIYIAVLAAQICRGKMPSELHQETRKATRDSEVHSMQACWVVQYGTITVCTVRTVLAVIRRTTVIVTPYFTVIMVKYGTVYGTIPSWHCQCKNGFRKASPPQHLPFLPTACSSYVLTPHNVSLNDPEAGMGLHQLGGRAQLWLAWKLKSEAVRNSWLVICVLSIVAKGKVMFWGAKRPNFGQNYAVRGTVLYGRTPYFQTDVLAPYCTAYYGTIS